MLITATILALLALAIIGRGHVADSRLDAHEYPFVPSDQGDGVRFAH